MTTPNIDEVLKAPVKWNKDEGLPKTNQEALDRWLEHADSHVRENLLKSKPTEGELVTITYHVNMRVPADVAREALLRHMEMQLAMARSK